MPDLGDESATFVIERTFRLLGNTGRWAGRNLPRILYKLGVGGVGLTMGAIDYGKTLYERCKLVRATKQSKLYANYLNGERIYNFKTEKEQLENLLGSKLSSDRAALAKQELALFDTYRQVMDKMGYPTEVNATIDTDDNLTCSCSTKFPLVSRDVEQVIGASKSTDKMINASKDYIDASEQRFKEASEHAFDVAYRHLEGQKKTYVIQDSLAHFMMPIASEHGISLTAQLDENENICEQLIECNYLESLDLEQILKRCAVRGFGQDTAVYKLSQDDFEKMMLHSNMQNFKTTSYKDVQLKATSAHTDVEQEVVSNNSYSAFGFCDATTENKVVTLFISKEDMSRFESDAKRLGVNYKLGGKKQTILSRDLGKKRFDIDKVCELARMEAKSLNRDSKVRVFNKIKTK